MYKFIKKNKIGLNNFFCSCSSVKMESVQLEQGEIGLKPVQKNSADLLITSTPALPEMSFSIIYRAVCCSVRLNQSLLEHSL